MSRKSREKRKHRRRREYLFARKATIRLLGFYKGGVITSRSYLLHDEWMMTNTIEDRIKKKYEL